jgi:hypothetical protein
MEVSKRKKRKNINKIINWFMSSDASGSNYRESLFLHEDPEDMLRLILLLKDYDKDIKFLQSWISKNKKMVEELQAEDLKEVQDFFKIDYIQNS